MTSSPARVLKADSHGSRPTGARLRLADLAESAHSSVGRSSQPKVSTSPFQPLFATSPKTDATDVSDATERDHELSSALQGLQKAVNQLRTEQDQWLDACQREVVRLGIAIADRLLRQSLSTRPETVSELVRTVLNSCVGSKMIRLRMNPADCELIEPKLQLLRNGSDNSIEFVPDETMTRGDCIAESSNGVIDGRIETMLDRIAVELLDEAE